MEVTIWIKRNPRRCEAAIRKGEAIEPRKGDVMRGGRDQETRLPQHCGTPAMGMEYRGTVGVVERGAAPQADM